VLGRLRALCDMMVSEVREYAGLHDYDGVVQDLSPAGVRTALGRLGGAEEVDDAHDAAHLAAAEAGLLAAYGELEEHRSNPLVHLANLDLACYDREYAPATVRARARLEHLGRWPEAVDAAVESLDAVPAPVAEALVDAARGLAEGIAEAAGGDDRVAGAARAAHRRLVSHLEAAAADGPPEVALGSSALARLMGDPEATTVDLGRLAERAAAERDRLSGLLGEACARLEPGTEPADLVARLVSDHPGAEGIYAEARDLIAEATEFSLAADLLGDLGGECLVGPAPPSRRWAMAMMSWTAPYEEEAPAWYYVNPPDPTWPEEEQEEWLSVFSRTTLPAITVHEVTPGHFAHGRMLRRLSSDVRRTLYSSAFVEGWAHYVEELMVEEGFRADDPRFAVGVYVEALVRVTRLAVAIGMHTGSMSLDEAVRAFEGDAFLRGPAARSEARRASFDPTYGRYTWGKLEILSLRDEAMARWGNRYSHRRFHEALLGLGAPPLGLMGDALDA
jgi:hypothetical protein